MLCELISFVQVFWKGIFVSSLQFYFEFNAVQVTYEAGLTNFSGLEKVIFIVDDSDSYFSGFWSGFGFECKYEGNGS